ncbi:MAG: threonine--tRNA ligase [Thermoplasmata archaeon]
MTFADGTKRSATPGISARELLVAWRPEESGQFLAARLDGELIDLARAIERPGLLLPVTFEDRAGREILHHSAAHVVAKAVCEVVPEARPTVGPGSEEGFHYDFDMPPITPEVFERIRSASQRIVSEDQPFERRELGREEALRLFSGNPHKQGFIERAGPEETISVYRTGEWSDLCRGPHVPSTRWLAGLYLLGFSGVTQGGTPGGLPLQRLRGVAFPTRALLDEYRTMRREAEARDHRVLGARLELFHFVEEAPGLPFWLPRGMVVLRELERFVGEHLKEAGYSEVRTPLLFASSVFETSGHWEHFRENMFITSVDGRPYGIKPMNCPGAMLVFKARARSYRELPMRLAEWAPLHRLEASGTLHGLTRVREFIQDDAHIFLTDEQIEPEIRTLLKWIEQAFATLELSWRLELSTRPEKFLGEIAQWDRAEEVLRRVLDSSGATYRVNPGDGAFYGPKIDVYVRDSIGRSWQTGTIQVDYQQPIRFGLEYQGADGALHRPVVVHRTVLGSFERFTGILIEHCAGRFPPWLAPVQVRVLPVAERHQSHAHELAAAWRRLGIRADATDSETTLSKRVRAGEVDKVPYLAVVGDAEVAGGQVTLRIHGEKAPRSLTASDAVELLVDRIRSRSFRP